MNALRKNYHFVTTDDIFQQRSPVDTTIDKSDHKKFLTELLNDCLTDGSVLVRKSETTRCGTITLCLKVA